MTVSTMPVAHSHIEEIVTKLREYDQFDDPRTNLEAVMKTSLFSQSIFFDNKLGVVWGLQAKSFTDEVGLIWMLTTSVVEQHKKAFLRRSIKITKMVLGACPVIRCIVNMRHVKSHDWLIWLGFKTIGMETVNGQPFYVMELRA